MPRQSLNLPTKTISDVTRDSFGRLTSWVEDGYKFSVYRNAAGKPVEVVGAGIGKSSTLRAKFSYNGNGSLNGLSGDNFETFRDELLSEGRGDGLALRGDPVAGFPSGWSGDAVRAAMGVGVVYPVIASTPAGFRWTTHGLRIGKSSSGDRATTDFLITDLIPAPSKTYYVDPINGNDVNAGTSAGAALANLSTALAKTDVDQIQIVGLTSDYVALGAKGWNNATNQGRSIAVINRTGYRFISAKCASLPTWVATSGRTSVYETTITDANSKGVIDCLSSSVVQYADKTGTVRSLANLPKRYRTLVKVASIAAVETTAGSWHHDGTKLYVRAHDSRNLVGDVYMLPTDSANNGRLTPTASNLNFYVEGIDFCGGAIAFLVYAANSISGTQFAHSNCSFQGANTVNGLAIQANAKVYGYRSLAADNYRDGYNYHSFSSDASNDANSPNAVEIECAAIGNGTTGNYGISDNSSTAHEACSVIRLGGVYLGSSGRNLADIDYSHTWNIDCHVGQPTVQSSSRESVIVAGNAKVWLDASYAEPGTNPRWASIGTAATLYHCNSGPVVNNTTGESTGAVRAYLG